LERLWEWGGRENAVGKELGNEEAGKRQWERGWEWIRQGKGSWKGGGNRGGRERAVGKWLGI
jgi:hypothetical protein